MGCTTHSTELKPGEGLLLFTDGLEDVQGPGGDRFGTARITHMLTQLRGATAADTLAALKAEAVAFGHGRLPDDLCMLAFRLHQTHADPGDRAR